MPNLAAALAREPRIARRARFVGMDGSVRIGYGGVSTCDQHPEAQHDALAASRLRADLHRQGVREAARRPELDKVLLSAKRAGDQLVVTKR